MYVMLNDLLILQALLDASKGTLGDVCRPAHLPSDLPSTEPAVSKVSSCALLITWVCCRVLSRPRVSYMHHKKGGGEHVPANQQPNMLPEPTTAKALQALSQS